MSMGYGGYAHKSMDGDKYVEYSYGNYTLNEPGHRNEDKICDGLIRIDKSSLPPVKIDTKKKKMPSGKKKIIEKKKVDSVNYEELVDKGMLQVVNSTNTWRKSMKGIDCIAWLLLYTIMGEYEKNGVLPEDASYHC